MFEIFEVKDLDLNFLTQTFVLALFLLNKYFSTG